MASTLQVGGSHDVFYCVTLTGVEGDQSVPNDHCHSDWPRCPCCRGELFGKLTAGKYQCAGKPDELIAVAFKAMRVRCRALRQHRSLCYSLFRKKLTHGSLSVVENTIYDA